MTGTVRRVRLRTSGTRRTAAVTATTRPAQPHSAGVRPKASSAGPASAIASGSRETEPNQSYAETRESFSSGISWCSTVIQETPKTSTMVPDTNITT